MKTHTIRFFLVLSIAALAGCSREPDLSGQEGVDLAQTADVYSGPGPSAPAPRDLARVLAKVNGVEITARQVEQESAAIALRLRAQLSPERIAQQQDQIRQQALDSLINKNLLLEAVKAGNVEVPKEQLDQRKAELVKTLPAGSSLQDHLARVGITVEQFDEGLLNELRINQLLETQVTGSGKPDAEAIKAFYDANTERMKVPEISVTDHIVVLIDPMDSPEQLAAKREQAQTLSTDLESGNDVKSILGNAANRKTLRGGRVSFTRDQTPAELLTPVFEGEIGAVAEVIESKFGFHVLKVVERREGKDLTLEEATPRIETFLLAQSQQQAVQDYLKGLRDKADIVLTP